MFEYDHSKLTEPIFRRCIENEGTKNWTQKRVFLDVHAGLSIIHSGWITCYEATNRFVPSRIFLKVALKSQTKAKFSSRISKICHYHEASGPNEDKLRIR